MSFSNTIKCPDCGIVYHKGTSHTCAYSCPDCGVKVYSETHVCDPSRVKERLVEKFADELRGAELTPRMKKQIQFLEWCRVNDRP